MRRLLQGEVGSGKTLVALLAVCQAVEAGAQAAILVPTETLAEQHLRTLDALLAPAGLAPVLLTGRVPRAERDRRLLALAPGRRRSPWDGRSVGGAFTRLGLAVVDGSTGSVEQRRALSERTAGARRRAPLLHDGDHPRTPPSLRTATCGLDDPAGSRRAPVETVSATTTAIGPTSVRASCGKATRRTSSAFVEEGEAAEARAATTERPRSLPPFSVGSP
jgi:ATP-dependent DNA helicase RecG